MKTVLLAALALALSLPAAAQQVLYKWTDAQGRVHYGDKPPKDFKGAVQRIDVEPVPAVPLVPPAAGPKAPVPSATAPAQPPAPPVDIASQRRATRERLQADIDAAQARLDAARKALAEIAPNEDERQVVQQYPAGTPGSLPPGQRSNCATVAGADGKPLVRCAALVPSGAYYERLQALEQQVKQAEDALSEAQNAYRRGVD